jgi:hypothetical protein
MNKDDKKIVGPFSTRNTKKISKTSIHQEIFDHFIELGCQKDIVNRINNQENPLNISIFVDLLLFCQVTSKFCQDFETKAEFLESFEDSLHNYIHNGSLESCIKDFKFDYYEAIKTKLRNTIVYGDTNAKRKVVHYLILDMAYICLKSKSLVTRVNGVKEIHNYSQKVTRGIFTEIKKDEMGEWLSNHNIIEEIYGSNHHSELISRSEFIIKILCKSKTGIKQEEVELIWNLTHRDNQTKNEIFTILQEIGETLGKDFIKFITDKILAVDQITSQDLNLLYAFKSTTTVKELNWKILENSDTYPEDISQTAFEKVTDSLKHCGVEDRLKRVNQCIEYLAQHKSSLIFIKILKSAINNTNASSVKIKNLTDDFEVARTQCELYFFEVSYFERTSLDSNFCFI